MMGRGMYADRALEPRLGRRGFGIHGSLHHLKGSCVAWARDAGGWSLRDFCVQEVQVGEAGIREV